MWTEGGFEHKEKDPGISFEGNSYLATSDRTMSGHAFDMVMFNS